MDVAQDVIINEEDCGTLRGLTATAIKRNDDVVQTLYDRILGRTALNDVIHPLTGEVICKAGEEITESIAGDREVAAGVGRDPLGADLRGAPRRMRQNATAATLPLPAWCRRAKWSAIAAQSDR